VDPHPGVACGGCVADELGHVGVGGSDPVVGVDTPVPVADEVVGGGGPGVAGGPGLVVHVLGEVGGHEVAAFTVTPAATRRCASPVSDGPTFASTLASASTCASSTGGFAAWCLAMAIHAFARRMASSGVVSSGALGNMYPSVDRVPSRSVRTS